MRKVKNVIAILLAVLVLFSSFDMGTFVKAEDDENFTTSLENVTEEETKEETEAEHVHSSDCYKIIKVLKCNEQHTHEEGCFTYYQFLVHDEQKCDNCELEKQTYCDKTEHTHSLNCFTKIDNTICNSTAVNHEHSDDCYYFSLTCDIPEHRHDNECYYKEIKHEEVKLEENVQNEINNEAEELDIDENIDFSSMRLIVSELAEEDRDVIVGEYSGVYILQYSSIEEVKRAYAKYSESNFVYVDEDFKVASENETPENTTEIMTEEENPFTELEQLDDIPKSKEPVIAVIDTGVNSDNLFAAVSVIGEEVADDNGHGTSVAEMILANNPDAKILSIKAMDSNGHGTASALYAAIEYAISQKVDIINLSVSSRRTTQGSLIEEAIKRAIDNNILVVGAAGNNAENAINYIPGSINDIIVVGSCDEEGNRLQESNYGNTVDVFATADSTSLAAAKVSGLLSLYGFYGIDTTMGVYNNYDIDVELDEVSVSPEVEEYDVQGLLYPGSNIYTSSSWNVSQPALQAKYPNIFPSAGGIGIVRVIYRHIDRLDGRAIYDYLGAGGTGTYGRTFNEMNRVVEHFWNDDSGNVYYCYDFATNDSGYRADVPFNSLNSYYPRSKIYEVYKWATALTQDNFALIRQNASSIAQGVSYNGITIRKSDVERLLRDDNAVANSFKRALVQILIWDTLNHLNMLDHASPVTFISGTVGKGGSLSGSGRGSASVQINPLSLINTGRMIGIGKQAQIELPPPEDLTASVGNTPGSSYTNRGNGQLLIKTPSLVPGSFTLKKKSSNPSVSSSTTFYTLAGATYTLYDDSFTAIATITTNKSGKTTTVEELEPGYYYVKETKPPQGFKLDPNTYEIRIGNGEDVEYEVSDDPYFHGNVKVIKLDELTGAKLSGAVFEVQKLANNTWVKVENLKETSKGVYVSSELYADATNPEGIFRIVEKTAPAAHKNTNYTKQFRLTASSQTFEYTVLNPFADVKIKVYKYDKRDKSKTPLTDAVFYVIPYEAESSEYVFSNGIKMTYNSSTKAYEATVSPSVSNAGWFKIYEDKAPSGYTGDYSKQFKIDTSQTTIPTIEYEAFNDINRVKAVAEIDKKNLEGENLEGAEFTVYAYNEKTNKYDKSVCKMEYKDGQYVSDVLYRKDKEYDKDLGDKNNGRFMIKETKSPKGYINEGQTLYFTIPESEDYETISTITSFEDVNGNTINKAVINKPNEVTIFKKNRNDEPLEGVVFRFGRAGEEKARYTAGEDGKLTFKALAPGKYQYYEEETIDGYALSNKLYAFDVSVDGRISGNDAITYYVINEHAQKLKINKLYETNPILGNNFEIPDDFPVGTIFDVYEWAGEGYAAKPIKKIVYNATLNKFVDQGSTEATLVYSATNEGKFKIVERKPSDGFVIGDNYIAEVTISSVKTNNVDENDIELPIEVEFSNKPNSFTINKTNIDNEPLQGVKFNIWRVGYEHLVTEYTTNEEGKIIVGALEPGEWKYQEVETITGYKLDDTVRSFTVASDGTIENNADYSKTIINNKITTLNVVKYDSSTGLDYSTAGVFPDGTLFDIYEWDDELGDYKPTPIKRVELERSIFKTNGEKKSYSLDDIPQGNTKDQPLIALIDTGTMYHPNITQRLSTIGKEVWDENGHGTLMARVILGENPHANIISIKAFDKDGNGSPEGIIEAIDLAMKAGAEFINMSFSAQRNEDNEDVITKIQEAIDSGITVVGSAGIGSEDVNNTIPGSIKDVIVVSATKKEDSENLIDYYINADSSSEATAMVTGKLSVNEEIVSEEVNNTSSENETQSFSINSQNTSGTTVVTSITMGGKTYAKDQTFTMDYPFRYANGFNYGSTMDSVNASASNKATLKIKEIVKYKTPDVHGQVPPYALKVDITLGSTTYSNKYVPIFYTWTQVFPYSGVTAEFYPAYSTSYRLNNKGNTLTNNNPIQIYKDDGSNAQKWVLNKTSTGWYQIKNIGGKYEIGISGNSDSVNFKLYTYVNDVAAAGATRQFRFYKYPDGSSVVIACRNNGLVMDIAGATFTNSNPVTSYLAHTSSTPNSAIKAQAWGIKRLTYSVTYNNNNSKIGSTGVAGMPGTQYKSSASNLTLSSTKPTATAVSYTDTANFNANGGTSTGASGNKLTATRKVTPTFNSWNTKADGTGTKYNAGAVYSTNADTTLYAQWVSSATGSQITLPTPTRASYRFDGWYTAASGGTLVGKGGVKVNISSATTYAAQTVTYYAHWTALYNVTYNGNKATIGNVEPKSVPTTQTKVHAVDLTLSTTKPTADAAKYTDKFVFKPNGGTSTGASGDTITSTRTITHTFNNWNTKADGSGTKYSPSAVYKTNAALALYAQWNRTQSASQVTLPTPTRAGYKFNGWYTAATGGTKIGNAGAKVYIDNTTTYAAKTTTLYAQWTPYKLTIKYHINGGKLKSTITTASDGKQYKLVNNIVQQSTDNGATWTDSFSYATVANEYIDLYNIGTYGGVRSGYTATGVKAYNKNAAGTSTNYNQDYSATSTTNPVTIQTLIGTTTLTSDQTVTIYVNWQPVSYNITYDMNEGTNNASNPSKYTIKDLPITLKEPTMEGYVFRGWTGSNGTVPQKSVTIPANTIGDKAYTANWRPADYKIFVDSETGEEVVLEETELNKGKYKIVEVQSSPGYILANPNPYQTFVIDDSGVKVLSFNNTPNELQIKKYNENNVELSGAKVKVWKAGTSESSAITYNLPAILKALSPGVWNIKETAAPTGYVLDETIHTVNVNDRSQIENQDAVYIKSILNIQAPNNKRLTIRKISDNGEALPNVTFKLSSPWAQINGTKVTNNLGIINLDLSSVTISNGDYIEISEISTVGSHIKLTSPIKLYLTTDGKIARTESDELTSNCVTVSSNAQILTVKNRKNTIEIQKVDENNVPLANVTFRCEELNKEYIADIYGKINISGLAPGTYHFVEVSAPNGYICDGNITVVVDEDGFILDGDTRVYSKSYTVKNNKNKLKLIKKSENNEVLENAVYRIWNEGSVSYDVTKSTDVNGEITLEGLPSGQYYYQETTAPAGYILDTDIYEFKVNADGTIYADDMTVEDNTITRVNAPNNLKIVKVDDLGNRIADVKFTLSHTPFNSIPVEMELDDEYITNSNGEIFIENIYPGTYSLTEVSTPDKYELDSSSKIFKVKVNGKLTVVSDDLEVISESSTGTQALQFSVTNTRKISGEVKLEKLDEVTDEKLHGAIFKLSEWNEELEEYIDIKESAEEDGEYSFGVIYKTESNKGKYKITETKAPDGYVCSWEKEFIMNDLPESEYFFSAVNNTNKVIITKINDSNEELPGVVFELTKPDGSTQEMITDSNGKITLEKLAPGEYTFKETKALDQYVLDTATYSFTVDSDGTINGERIAELEPIVNYWMVEKFGQIELQKLTASDMSNLGAEFTIYEWDGEKYDTEKTYSTYYDEEANVYRSQGYLPLTTVNQGKFKIVETKAPSGLFADYEEEIEFNLGEDLLQTLQLDAYNDTNKLRIHKVDNEGQPLTGVTFELLSSDSSTFYVEEFEVDENGYYCIESIPQGTYKLREISTAEGYLVHDLIDIVVDEKGYISSSESDLSSGEYDLVVPNYKNKVKFIKYKAGTTEPVVGAVYAIDKIENQDNPNTYTTSTEPIVLEGLDPGTYYYEELSSPEGYQKTEGKLPFYVDEDGKVTHDLITMTRESDALITAIDLSDDQEYPEGKIKIKKIDSVTRENLSTASFAAFSRVNPLAPEESTVISFTYDEASGYYISDNTLVANASNAGLFNLVEVDAPEGYTGNWKTTINLWDAVDGDFIIDDNGVKTWVFDNEHVVENDPLNIKIKKIDAATNEPMEGVVFEIWEGSTEEKENVVQYITDDSGYINLTNVESGKTYFFKEIRTLSGYALDRGTYSFSVDYNGNIVENEDLSIENNIITVENEPMRNSGREGEITLTKIGAGGNENLGSGGIFDIYEWAGDSYTTVPIGYLAYDTESKTYKATVEINAYNQGKFKLHESVAPFGYSAEYDEEIQFEDGSILVELIAENRKIEISTTASDNLTSSNIGISREHTTITDIVRYENLIPGKEYTLVGYLVDEDGNEIMYNDERVEASSTFTAPETISGIEELKFTFDSTGYAGRNIVVFEELYLNDALVAEHRDLSDTDQTVFFKQRNSLTVEKQITGNMRNITDEFNFKVELKNEYGLKLITSDITYDTEGNVYDVSIREENDTVVIRFVAGDDGKLILNNIPYATEYTVTEIEENQNGYETSYSSQTNTFDNSDEVCKVINRKHVSVATLVTYHPERLLPIGIASLLLLVVVLFRRKFKTQCV